MRRARPKQSRIARSRTSWVCSGELAKAAAVNAQTIRYYEREGLLRKPHRWRDSNYRDFDDDALERLRLILSAKDLGFSLREIKELLDLRVLPPEACDEVKPLIAAKLVDVERRLVAMRRLRRILKRLHAACEKHTAGMSCPVLRTLEKPSETKAIGRSRTARVAMRAK